MRTCNTASSTLPLTHGLVPQVNVAWGQVLRSLPFWAMTVMHVGYNWGYYTIASELPVYMANMQHFTISSVSLLPGSPAPSNLSNSTHCLLTEVLTDINRVAHWMTTRYSY